MSDENRETLTLLQLPEEILENIVSFFTYNETSEARLVSEAKYKHELFKKCTCLKLIFWK